MRTLKVDPRVFGNGDDLQIRRRIITLVAVDMMDSFTFGKWAPDHVLGYKHSPFDVSGSIGKMVPASFKEDVTILYEPSTTPQMMPRTTESLMMVEKAIPLASAPVSLYRTAAAAFAQWWISIGDSHRGRLLCGDGGQGLAERVNAVRVPLII